MIKIDALGLACPEPVIRTKKAIKENENETEFIVYVDNEVATENLTKMANELKIESSVEKIADKKYQVSLKKVAESKTTTAGDSEGSSKSLDGHYTVVINSNKLGGGDEQFSQSLLESFIYSLSEQDILPDMIICYNSGVFCTTKNEKCVEDLKAMAEKGVKIYSCGLCLGNYGLKEELKVGEITNMYRIVEIMRTNNVIFPC